MTEATLNIDGIGTLVEDIIKAKVVTALAGRDAILEKLVTHILSQEIEHTIGWGHSKRTEKKQYLEAVLHEVVEKVVARQVSDMLKEEHEQIQSHIRQLVREKHVELLRQLAKATMNVSEANGNEISIEVSLNHDK